jgi:hypothetical protein
MIHVTMRMATAAILAGRSWPARRGRDGAERRRLDRSTKDYEDGRGPTVHGHGHPLMVAVNTTDELLSRRVSLANPLAERGSDLDEDFDDKPTRTAGCAVYEDTEAVRQHERLPDSSAR